MGSTSAGISIDSQIFSIGENGLPFPESNSVINNVITNFDGSGAKLVANGADDNPVGLWISNSPGNTANHNTISGYGIGVYVSGPFAQNNEIWRNVIDAGSVAELAKPA